MSTKAHNKVDVRVESINPELAKSYLNKMGKNRHVTQHHLKTLVRDMKAGRWVFNGDPIRFNGEKLIDGQHRLNALIESGKTLDFVVIRQLPKEAFDTMWRAGETVHHQMNDYLPDSMNAKGDYDDPERLQRLLKIARAIEAVLPEGWHYACIISDKEVTEASTNMIFNSESPEVSEAMTIELITRFARGVRPKQI